jgi:uncharacterized protein GlcG (DUF336 family)
MVTLEAEAERKASEIGLSMNAAVVDEGGKLLSHVRMDGAWLGIDISINEAHTLPSIFRRSTSIGA